MTVTASNLTTKVTYRLIGAEEWDRVAEVFRQIGRKDSLPSPEGARVVIAEDADGRLVGFLVLQMVLHAEPLWILPGVHVYVPSLIREIESCFAGPGEYFVFAESGNVEKLAEAIGMERMPYTVFRKKVI